MSVKKEPSGRRSIEVETVVPGSVEEVWQAIATGPGVSAWFATCEIDEEVGGEIRVDMGGGMERVGTITAWEPLERYQAEGQPWGEDAPAFATEWSVEALSGDTCRVRVVHSLFADSDDWDGELEDIETGWPGFFQILGLYMEHFPGEPCTVVRVMQPTGGTVAEAWRALTAALELGDAAPQQAWGAPEGAAPTLAGIVEVVEEGVKPKAVVRLERPAPGVASAIAFPMAGMTLVSLGLYLYGEGAAAVAEREQAAWAAWFVDRFPPPQPPA